MVKKRKKTNSFKVVEQVSDKLTLWIGTPLSIIFHTLFFVGIFFLQFAGIGLDKVLLILTTAVSLEAIYLAIFIQITVNKNTKSLEAVEDDIEDIQEDVEDIQEDVEVLEEDTDAISKDVKGLESDVEEISDDLDQIQEESDEEKTFAEATKTLQSIEKQMQNLTKGLTLLKEDLDHLKNRIKT